LSSKAISVEKFKLSLSNVYKKYCCKFHIFPCCPIGEFTRKGVVPARCGDLRN